MNVTFTRIRILAILPALMAMTHFLGAASREWTGASGLDLFWSTPGNWSPVGPAGSPDDVRFFDPGAVLDPGTINSTVSANTSVRSLWLGHTNGFHNVLIQPGVILTVSGTNDNGYGPLGSDPTATAPNPNVQSLCYVGTKSEVAANTVVTGIISGENGTLVLDNLNNELNIRQAWGAGGGPHRAVLDMSGLGTFVARLGRIRIGDGEAGAIRRAEGQLILARTNRITLSGPSVAEDVQLVIGNNDVNNNGNGSISYLVLGQDNRLNVSHVLVGGRKQQGNIHFLESLTTPSLVMRGTDGASRMVALRIGDESDQANSGNPTTGTVDLRAGTVDIRAETVIVGKGQQQTGREALGFLTLGQGVLDVNTLELAFQTSDTANNRVDGTVSFLGTTVLVNDLLRMGRSAGAAQPRNATLNIDGGSVTVGNRFLTEGTATINVTNGLLALRAGAAIQANQVALDGGTISNALRITVTNSLTIVNNGRILGHPVLDMGNSGSATWNVQGAPGGGLVVSNTLQGSGSYSGDLIQAPGATLSPGGSSVAGTLSVLSSGAGGGNATFNGGTLRFDLSASALAANDKLVVAGDLALNATNDVNLTALGGVLDTLESYTLITAGLLFGDQTHFRVSGPLAQSRYTFGFDTASTPNAVRLAVAGTGPAALTWTGDGAANTWNLKGAANWTRGAGPEQFFSLDAVTFDDTGSAAPAVNLAGALTPSAMTVNNPTKNYTFSGSGGVQGAPLTKAGAGALTFSNSGDNAFGGAVAIQAGAVTFSNNGLNTFANGLAINGGSVTLTGGNTNSITGGALSIGAGAALTVANSHPNNFGGGLIDLDGALMFNQTVDATLDGILSGGGTLVKAGSGTLTLANDNGALSSVIQINAGTIRAGNPSALGVTGVTIAGGGGLNINGQNLSALPVAAAGAGPDGKGAIVNTAAPQLNALVNVTLEGNTAFGGSGPWNTDPVLNFGRWDIRGGSLSTGGQPLDITKTGLNQVTLAGVMVDAALSDIDVQLGLLALEGPTTSLGDPAGTLTVRAGATVSFFDTTTAWDKRFVLFGNGVTPNFFNWNGANTIAGPVALNGDCVIGAAPPDRGTPLSLTLSGPVEGSGRLTKVSADTLVLSGTYTYTGDTALNAGTLALTGDGSIPGSPNITIQADATLDVAGAPGGTLTLANGQTLRGNGTINGTLIASSGSTLSPGLSIGALSASGDITLQGATSMDLDPLLDTNDVLRGSIIDFGGTLRLTTLAGNLSPGDSFKLFDASAYSGSFATIVPATPGPGLNWDTGSLLTTGVLSIGGTLVAQPGINAISLSGDKLIFRGTNGTPGAIYYVLSSTNVELPAMNWTRILTNTFDGAGAFNVTNAVNPGEPRRFFQLQTP